MNGVSSFSLDNLPVEMLETKPGKAIGLEHSDERKSGYRLYWVGLCSESALREIREVFNLYAADLKYGIEAGDIEQIEWTLAPTLLRCSTANARQKRSRRIRNYFLALFVLLYTIALLFFLARYLFGF